MKMREIEFKELENKQVLQSTIFEQKTAVSWNNFVQSSNNGTLFHTRKFLSYHPESRFEDSSVVFKKENKIAAVFPAAIRENALISHPGASFGGPVFHLSFTLKDAFRVVESLVEFSRKKKFNRISLTLPPQIYYKRPSNYIDFALLKSGFEYQKREVSSVIPLDFAAEDALLAFSPESRRAARRAAKLGVEIKQCEDFATFYAILNHNLNMRHNVQPTHSLKELILLKEMFPDEVLLFGAFAENQMIAGVVVFLCNHQVALAFYISHREDMQHYRPVNLLFYEIIRWAICKQIKFLDFGIFTVNMVPNWGLARFKESFGALGVFRDTFVKTLA